MTDKSKNNGNGNGTNEKVCYRGSPLGGWEEDGRKYTPKQMLAIYERYEELLAQRKFNETRMIEKEERIPEGWLTRVVSEKIMESPGSRLARELVREFAYMGYDSLWLKNGQRAQTIKGKR